MLVNKEWLQEKAETWSESLWTWVITLPRPFTAVVTVCILGLAGVGVASIVRAL